MYYDIYFSLKSLIPFLVPAVAYTYLQSNFMKRQLPGCALKKLQLEILKNSKENTRSWNCKFSSRRLLLFMEM